MTKSISLFLILLFLPCLVSAQALDEARAVVSMLASPAMKGRGYVARGDSLAAGFIASKFRTFGLQTFGSSYFQPFEISVNTFPNQMGMKIDGATLRPGIDYLVEPYSPGIAGDFDVVATDRSKLATDRQFLDFFMQTNGKVAFIDNRGRTAESEERRKQTDEYINFIKFGKQTSCQAVILLSDEKLTWTPASHVNTRPVLTIVQPMEAAKVKKVSLTIGQEFIEHYTTNNVVGYVAGRVEPDSFLVVTAHYDHLGMMGSSTLFPGANDNASGVAMLLSLAGHYTKNPPDYSMVFITTSGEELGLLGAKYFTEHPLFDLTRIKFLVNFDLAGTGDEGIRVVNGSVHRAQFDMLTALNDSNKYVSKVDIRGAACNSDHCLFDKKGVPCFYIYTQGGTQSYHDVYDRAETLPLTAFDGYRRLMIRFFDTIQ